MLRPLDDHENMSMWSEGRADGEGSLGLKKVYVDSGVAIKQFCEAHAKGGKGRAPCIGVARQVSATWLQRMNVRQPLRR